MEDVSRNESRSRASALVLGLAMLGAATVPVISLAAEPLALRKIMSDLGQEMQAVTDGLAREEYANVEQAAQAIAEHPQPPLSEKVRIIGFVGTRMAQFKAYDQQTHDHASAIIEAARQQNAPAAIDAFRALQLSCHGCHQDFRRSFVEHFYGAK